MFLVSQAQFSEFKSNLQRNLRKQICELKRASGSQRLPICHSKYQCCGGSLQSCPEENIRFGCERIFRCKPTDTFSTKLNLFANKSQKKGKKDTPTRPRVGVLLTPVKMFVVWQLNQSNAPIGARRDL